MAKLNALGRTVIYSLVKTEGTIIYHKRLMSDGVVLYKSSYLDSCGKRCPVNWTVAGKLKNEVAPETWYAHMIELDWR